MAPSLSQNRTTVEQAVPVYMDATEWVYGIIGAGVFFCCLAVTFTVMTFKRKEIALCPCFECSSGAGLYREASHISHCKGPHALRVPSAPSDRQKYEFEVADERARYDFEVADEIGAEAVLDTCRGLSDIGIGNGIAGMSAQPMMAMPREGMAWNCFDEEERDVVHQIEMAGQEWQAGDAGVALSFHNNSSLDNIDNNVDIDVEAMGVHGDHGVIEAIDSLHTTADGAGGVAGGTRTGDAEVMMDDLDMRIDDVRVPFV